MEYSCQKDSLKDRHGRKMYAAKATKLKTADLALDNHGEPDYDAWRCHTDRELYGECPPPCVVPLRRRFVNANPLPTALIAISQASLLGGAPPSKRSKARKANCNKARDAKAEGAMLPQTPFC